MPLCPGRDWKACAEHVGTRDSRAIASHAQKHFIKLCIKGELLPAKVAESGAGYTLSGKPLDPESAAAKAYGFKPGMLESEGPDLACLCCMPVSQQCVVGLSKGCLSMDAGLQNSNGASLAGIRVQGGGAEVADKENGDSANAGTAPVSTGASSSPCLYQTCQEIILTSSRRSRL